MQHFPADTRRSIGYLWLNAAASPRLSDLGWTAQVFPLGPKKPFLYYKHIVSPCVLLSSVDLPTVVSLIAVFLERWETFTNN